MGQVSRELYLIVLEYSVGLSEKQCLKINQPTNLNSRCFQKWWAVKPGGPRLLLHPIALLHPGTFVFANSLRVQDPGVLLKLPEGHHSALSDA